MEELQTFVMLAGYALGVVVAALAMEFSKAVIWACVFTVFYRLFRKK